MTTITERQSTTRQSSRNEAARLAGEVPSPPNELYGILRENAALSAKQQAVISKTAIPNVEDKPPLGTRNPYLPLLKRSSSLTSTISSGASTLARDIWSGLFHTPPSTRTSGSSTFSTIPETPIENSREDSIPQRPDRITPAPPINATSSTAGKNTIEHVSMTEEPPGQQLASTEPETSNEKSSKDLFPQRPDQITPAPSINATSSTVGKNTIEYASVAKEPPGQKLASAEPLKPYKVVQFGKRCYVCTEMPIPLETTRMWNESIKKLVEDVLHASSAAKADSETAMTLELYMANTTSKNLRPSILITCCSSKMKKQIRSVLGEKRWLKKSGFQYIVQVDKSFGYRTDDSGVEPFTLEIQARIPISPETFCGVEARIAPGTNEDDNPSIVKFTIGGMISIDGTLCYLAAAHPFAPASRPATVSSEASSEEDDSDGSLPTTSRSSSGTVINHTSNGNRGKGQTGEALPAPFPETFTETWPKLPYREISHGGVLAITRFRPGAENLDWALLIASNTPALPNMIQIPGEHKATPLLPDIITSTELTPGPVLVAAGSGLRRGNLNTSAASIFLRGSIHNVKQITLESSLPYGDSGSWVISENRLCGIIIAGRDHLPWAYMLPIEEVFLDIEKTCGFFPIINGGHEISDAQHLIPTEAYDYSQVETGTGSLAGPEERLSDVIHSAPIREIITENEKTQYSETPPNNLPGRVHPSVLHVFGLMLWIFLDDSGTSTAIPKITDHFNSLDDIGWYSSAFSLSTTAFCFPFEILYEKFHFTLIFLASISFCEIGSLVCGFSSTSIMFIFGRVARGIGTAGMILGAQRVLSLGPLIKGHQLNYRAYFLWSGLSMVAKPLIIGAITYRLGWNWAFYMDAIMGGLLLAMCLWGLRFVGPFQATEPFRKGYFSASVASVCFATGPLILSLFLVNWGGRRYLWSEGKVLIALFATAVVFWVSFALYLFSTLSYWWRKRRSTMMWGPPSLSQRHWSPVLYSSYSGAGLGVMVAYLPIWFQGVNNNSPLGSSVILISLTLSVAAVTVVSTTTFYSRFCFLNLLVGSMIATVAAGLMTLLTPEIDNSAQKAYAIGICVLLGTGVGLGFPIPFLAARLSHDRQFSQLVRLVTFPAGFGAIFLSVAQSIFVNTLASNLNDAVDNNITTKFLLDAGITNLPGMFPPDQQEAVLGAYNASLRNVFYLATGLFGVSIFGGLGMINVCRMWLEGTEAADEIQTRRPVSPLGAPEMGYGPLPLAPELNVGGIDRPTVISFPRELPGPRSVDGRLD